MAIDPNEPLRRAKQMLEIILSKDKARLDRIDRYMRGEHDDPYMPREADDEYRLLASRSTSNWLPLLVGTPAQACYVDNFRPGRDLDDSETKITPEWKHWQESRLDSRQAAIYRGALTFGHSFTVTEKDERSGKVLTRGLSAKRTAALFEDPANDDAPVWALTITRMPQVELLSQARSKGQAIPPESDLLGHGRMWNEDSVWEFTFESQERVFLQRVQPHNASSCPVTRFVASVDLEGRTVGVVEPMIPLQNRINQTIFDLLVAQTYNSTKVRWVTGMAPPIRMKNANAGNPDLDPEWVADLDENGQPQPLPLKSPNRRFMFASSPDTKFGQLDETPLDGFIQSIDMSIRHLSAISQTPPHYLLGQIANLSADALQAAEISLARKIDEFKASFGESWERVFRIAAELTGEAASADDYTGEVIWRDMEGRSLAAAADGLGKLKEQLQIPAEGLWGDVPGVTQNKLREWKRLKEEQDADLAQQDALYRAAGSLSGSTRGGQPAINNPRTPPEDLR